MKLPTLAM